MEEELKKLISNSYAKYSNYHVACLCKMRDGQVFPGVNVENASYGASVCAERVAIFNAIAHGYRKGDFHELHIMVDSDTLAPPCFLCRQVISEFFTLEDKIYLYSHNNQACYHVQDLCPYPFDEHHLY